jgi:hypothetical protein
MPSGGSGWADGSIIEDAEKQQSFHHLRTRPRSHD